MKEILKQTPIIPVITIDNIEDARALANLFLSHGFNTIEITLRTNNAIDIINTLSEEFKDLTIGAGTINDLNSMEKVVQSKAKFSVSPGFSTHIASLASIYSMPYLPGVATPSEVIAAKNLGFDCLKLFPSEVIGGVKWLKSMSKVFPEIGFCPTGGINLGNVADYLKLDNVISVGISSLAPMTLIRNRDWIGIKSILKNTINLNNN